MAKAADQFRSSDVTVWGIVAICCWGLAVVMANVSALIPASVLGGLHASRLDGGTVAQLRAQVVDMSSESDRLRRENNLLLQRFAMVEEAQGEFARRVGALEVSVPRLSESASQAMEIDSSATASVFEGSATTFDTDGGSVSVVRRPLVAIEAQPAATAPLADPQTVLPDGSSFGVLLGFPVAEGDAGFLWQDLLAKVGTLLIGLWPVTADSAEGGKTLIAGPIASETQAAELCARLDRVGIPCEPTPFEGEPLPLPN